MEQYALYLVMKKEVLKLSNDFKCSFNDMDFNKPNVVGIYVRGGNTPNSRELGTGKYYNYTARVQFIIQGDNSKQSLMSVLDIASRLRTALETSSNRVIVLSNEEVKWVNGKIVYDPKNELVGNDIEVVLCSVGLMGEVSFHGKNQMGLPKYSLNIYVNYYCKVKEEKQNGN